MNRHIRRKWANQLRNHRSRYPHVFTIDRALTDAEEKHYHGYFLDPKNGCVGVYMFHSYSGKPHTHTFEEGWFGSTWETTNMTTFYFSHVETMMMFRLMIKDK